MKLSLHKDLASTGWHTSILTTYSVDSAFYDSYVERRLRSYGVRNNILMADYRMLSRAMNAFAESFTGAGSRYAVVPIKVAGAFHPKLHLRLGERKASLVLGSANVTTMGWGKNQEVVTRLDWGMTSEPVQDNEVSLQLISRAYRYLKSWLGNFPGDSIRDKIELAERRSPWLRELNVGAGPLEAADGTLIDILFDHGGDSPSIHAQLKNQLGFEQTRRLILISPYWDANLGGFRDLRKTLGNPKTSVVLNPKTNTFPVKVLSASDQVEFFKLVDESSSKFVHAKIFIVQTEQWDHVVFGSANCSDDAIGYANGPSRNAEACVYRRYPRDTALSLLALNLDEKIDRKEINAPASDKELSGNVTLPPPGNLELHGSKLIWWPSQNATDGEAIEIAGQSLPLQQGHSSTWWTEFTGKMAYPLIAKIRFANGDLSSAAIVHCPRELKSAQPSQIDTKLRELLETAFHADVDLIMLANEVELIFPPEPEQQAAVTRSVSNGSGSGSENQRSTEPTQYQNEAEFRAAMLAPATGKSKQISNSETSIQDLFSVVVKGILPKVEPAPRRSDAEDEAILDGDTEDGNENENEGESDTTSGSTLSGQSPGANIAPESRSLHGPITYTSKIVQKRRKTLVTAIDKFEEYLNRLKEDSAISLSRLPVQTAFIFRLMKYGVTQVHVIREEEQSTSKRKSARAIAPTPDSQAYLLVFGEDSLGSNREIAFVQMCLRILLSLWTGTKPLGTRLAISASNEMLPDDIFEMIVVSRWALGRTLIWLRADAVKDKKWMPSRAYLKLVAHAPEIYKATASLGPIDSLSELNAFQQQEEAFGFGDAETALLLSTLNLLAASAVVKG
jgi:hypothetical protein